MMISATVSIVAIDPSAGEPADAGRFFVGISALSDSDTIITYTVSGDATSGSDFTALTGSVTIAANTSGTNLDVSVLDDFLLEDDETMIVTLTSITSGDADLSISVTDTAQVTITDDDTAQATIAATDSAASEPGNNGEFTVLLSNASDTDTVISYTVAGTATSGTDFAALTGSVTIQAGLTSATIALNTLDDAILESTESVTLTLDSVTSGDSDITIGAADSATVLIADDDVAQATITANDPNATEPGDHGQYTVVLSNVSDTNTIISYTVSGDATAGADFSALSGSVLIAAGATSATIDINILDDAILEDVESVIVTLDSIASGDAEITIGAANSATVNIADTDTAEVSIVASDSSSSEPGDPGQFTISITAPSDTDTLIAYTVTGDATEGSDFTALSGIATIAANTLSTTIDINVIDDSILEDDESITVTLNSITTGDAEITISSANTATLTLADDDVAEVTITANAPIASEPAGAGQFTVSLSNPSDTATIVSYTVSG